VTQLLTPVVLVCNEEFWLPFVLEASRGHFERYVIYDVGSTDQTRRIIEWFRDTSPGVDFFVRLLPMCAPEVQGAFRNSMIAEARTPYYFILDGDEIYPPTHYELLNCAANKMRASVYERKLYGLVRRCEWTEDLTMLHGTQRNIPHHRIYHREAIWRGTHPGERPFFEQKPKCEQWFADIVCHHFHHPARSTKDSVVPGRAERKNQATYLRTPAVAARLFDELPILRKQIEDFPCNPILKEMQERADPFARAAS
jgi:glycosyl transferase family 2